MDFYREHLGIVGEFDGRVKDGRASDDLVPARHHRFRDITGSQVTCCAEVIGMTGGVVLGASKSGTSPGLSWAFRPESIGCLPTEAAQPLRLLTERDRTMASDPRAQSANRFKDSVSAELGVRLEPVVQAQGLILEELEVKASAGQAVLRVTVDYAEGTEAVDLDTIAAIADALSAELDEDDPLPQHESYELEVTTPGATRPLTEARHFQRNVGRLLEIEREGQPAIVARLQGAETESITVSVQKPAPKKGMPVKYGEPEKIDLAAISKARVQVEFSHGDNGPGQPDA